MNRFTQPPKITNYLTIDVEDYYQVSAFEDVAAVEKWKNFESRVERNTRTVLDILDNFNTKATFFVVGWIAERHPEVVKEIVRRGHPVECHSYLHRKVYDLSPGVFKDDTAKAKQVLEDITGTPVCGYRAPSYSITNKSLWAVEILHELGFQYDSSIFPIVHDTYGIPDAPRYPFYWDLTGTVPKPINPTNQQPYKQSTHLKEYPISTARFLGHNVPAAGGGYFRLFPYWLTRLLLRKINRDEQHPFIFYLHPWEVDPGQPRFRRAKAFSKFRHYNNLEKTKPRLEKLLTDFKFQPIPS